MRRFLAKLRGNDKGASAVEYGLLVALIAVVIAGTIVLLGDTLRDKIQTACDSVNGATCTP